MPGHILFFTDGSKISSNVGASFVLYDNLSFIQPLLTHHFKILPDSSNNLAEALAILSAVSSIHRTLCNSDHALSIQLPINSNLPSHTNFHFYVDNMAALNNLRAPQKSFEPHIFHSICNLICDIPYHFHFHWIPSHKGYIGNEMADLCAKYAALSQTLPPYTPPTYSSSPVTKTFIKKKFIETLHANWDQLTTQRPYILNFFPNYEALLKYQAYLPQVPFLNNLISDHLPLSSHLYKKNIVEDPNCLTCGVQDTTLHLLFHCKRFLVQRHTWFQQIQLPPLDTYDMSLIFDFFIQHDVPKLHALNTFLSCTVFTAITTSAKAKSEDAAFTPKKRQKITMPCSLQHMTQNSSEHA
jgi:ribonuclease HI